MDSSDDFWIRAAIDLAQESRTPYGAIIVDPGDQYVSGYNTTIHDGATAHAEMNAIKKIADLDYNT
ncbi:MAG: tRNA(Arg) A34 adenosine deaminase TadA, partial [Marivirga sp.]